MPSPKQIEEKIRRVLNAWRDLAPTKKFGAMTLAEFEAKVQPSFDDRQQIAQAENRLSQVISMRDGADDVSMEAVQKVVNGVIGDPDEGPDSPMVEAMGYTRKSERKTGLTRKKNLATKGEKPTG
jgi:hypothetical protein